MGPEAPRHHPSSLKGRKGGPTHLPHLKGRVRKGSTLFDRWDFMIPSFILKVRKASLCHWRWTTFMFSPRWGYPQLKGPVLMLKLPFFLKKQVDALEGCLVVSVISWGRRDSRGREGVGEAQQRDKTTTNHMCTLHKSYTCTSSNLLWLNHCRRNGSWTIFNCWYCLNYVGWVESGACAAFMMIQICACSLRCGDEPACVFNMRNQ